MRDRWWHFNICWKIQLGLQRLTLPTLHLLILLVTVGLLVLINDSISVQNSHVPFWQDEQFIESFHLKLVLAHNVPDAPSGSHHLSFVRYNFSELCACSRRGYSAIWLAVTCPDTGMSSRLARSVEQVLSIPPSWSKYGSDFCMFQFSSMWVRYVTSEQIYHRRQLYCNA